MGSLEPTDSCLPTTRAGYWHCVPGSWLWLPSSLRHCGQLGNDPMGGSSISVPSLSASQIRDKKTKIRTPEPHYTAQWCSYRTKLSFGASQSHTQNLVAQHFHAQVYRTQEDVRPVSAQPPLWKSLSQLYS